MTPTEIIVKLDAPHLRQLAMWVANKTMTDGRVGLTSFVAEVERMHASQVEDANGDLYDPFNITDAQFVEVANLRYGNDGDLEFDDGALVSRGDDDGAYVHCWKWVYDSEVRVKLKLPIPICRECGESLMHDPDGSDGVVVHCTEEGTPDYEVDHAPVPEMPK